MHIIKVIIKSLVQGTDITELTDVGLYEIIIAADYFQMKDLVSVVSDMISAEITSENIHDVYDLTKFPFVYLSQYWFAEKILILDHSTFNRISEKCSGPTENCILINHTGRCGSTLLCQVYFM